MTLVVTAGVLGSMLYNSESRHGRTVQVFLAAPVSACPRQHSSQWKALGFFHIPCMQVVIQI